MTRAIARILRADLIVVDDVGLLAVSPDAAEGLYRLVDGAYERRSIAMSSNLHPSESAQWLVCVGREFSDIGDFR